MEVSRQERRPSNIARLRNLVALAGVCLAGCYSAGDVELLESQLRRQEDAIRSCRGELSRANEELARAQREIDGLYRQLAAAQENSTVLLPEEVHALAQVEDLAIDTWRSGLVNSSPQNGVDQLLLVLYPRDSDGQAVKVAGELELEALDLSLPTSEQLIGHWSFTQEQAGDLWHVGFVSVGYHVQIPLPITPQGSELLVHAVLTTADGRQFSVTHTLPLRRRSPPSTQSAGEPFGEFSPFATESSVAEPDLLPATSRNVRVPVPPGEFDVGVDAAAAGFEDTVPEDTSHPGDEGAPMLRRPDNNRHDGTDTSDNWTVETIPDWQ